MKIVFTTKGDNWNSPMDARFGRMEMLLIYDETTDKLEAIDNKESEAMEHGAGLQTAKKVMEIAPDIVITGNGVGQKVLDLLKRTEIKLYVGAGEMSVEEAYQAYRAGKLTLQF